MAAKKPATAPKTKRIGVSKKKYEKSELARKNANKRVRDVKDEMESALASAATMEVVWAAAESAVVVGGAATNGLAMGIIDKFVEDDWDLWFDVGAAVVGVVSGAVSTGAGLTIHPRLGTLGLAASSGFMAPSVADLTRMGVAQLLDMALPPAEAELTEVPATEATS